MQLPPDGCCPQQMRAAEELWERERTGRTGAKQSKGHEHVECKQRSSAGQRFAAMHRCTGGPQIATAARLRTIETFKYVVASLILRYGRPRMCARRLALSASRTCLQGSRGSLICFNIF